MLLLGSNDYLGLADHPEVVGGARDAAGRWGGGAGGSRLTTGNLAIHEQLEHELAALKRTEAALLFSSGYLAALGAIQALAGPGDLILSDALNHASLIDACRLSRAEVRVYGRRSRQPQPPPLSTAFGPPSPILGALREEKTTSPLSGRPGAPACGSGGRGAVATGGPEPCDELRELLQDRARFRRCLVVTDGVFSMDGDIAPLADLHALCRENDAWLMVDDAHATGVLGLNGGGTAEHFGLPPSDFIHMGTLSKALGSQGGFIAGPAVVIDYLRNRARAFIFDTAPAPACSGAALAALRIVRREPERRERLLGNARLFREALAPLQTGSLGNVTPIVPVIVGEADTAVALATRLEEAGIRGPAIRPPTVPAGTARLRLSVTAAHDEGDLRWAAQEIVRLWN